MSSSESTDREKESKEKETIINKILQHYEKLLTLSDHSNQLKEGNDYIQREIFIYKNYISNLEGRIKRFTDKQ